MVEAVVVTVVTQPRVGLVFACVEVRGFLLEKRLFAVIGYGAGVEEALDDAEAELAAELLRRGEGWGY